MRTLRIILETEFEDKGKEDTFLQKLDELLGEMASSSYFSVEETGDTEEEEE